MEHLGLVGLNGSQHELLFAALTGLDAIGASERVMGQCSLPDDRLDRLAEMSESKNVVHATFEIDWLPALSTEAGKGLGSRLLGSLRDCDAVLFVVRAAATASTRPTTSPRSSSSWCWPTSRRSSNASTSRSAASKGDKTLAAEIAALERAEASLGDGVPIYRSELTDDDRALLVPVFLLTNKPVLVVVNIGVDQIDESDALAAAFGDDALAVCLEIEGDPDVVAASSPTGSSSSPTWA